MSRTPPDLDDERAGNHTQALQAAGADYAPFGRWLDGELEKLVARWIHLAAPAAARREQVLRRLRR